MGRKGLFHITSSCPSVKEASAAKQAVTKTETNGGKLLSELLPLACSVTFSYIPASPYLLKGCSATCTPPRLWPHHTIPSIPRHLSMSPSILLFPLQLKLWPLLGFVQESSNLPQSANFQLFSLTIPYLQNRKNVRFLEVIFF